jgi:hypothetical protein
LAIEGFLLIYQTVFTDNKILSLNHVVSVYTGAATVSEEGNLYPTSLCRIAPHVTFHACRLTNIEPSDRYSIIA